LKIRLLKVMILNHQKTTILPYICTKH
jgi:hypothetical protein